MQNGSMHRLSVNLNTLKWSIAEMQGIGELLTSLQSPRRPLPLSLLSSCAGCCNSLISFCPTLIRGSIPVFIKHFIVNKKVFFVSLFSTLLLDLVEILCMKPNKLSNKK